MTRDEILAMEPGNELDIVVAINIIGWLRDEKIEFQGNIPHYSTDISAAWEVVKKLENDCAIAQATFRGKTLCTICEKVLDGNFFEYESPSAPEAIAKAALIACLESSNE